MDLIADYEQILEDELLLCQSQYALYQEIAWQATSEMTRWQEREEKLASDLARLREARQLFSQQPGAAHQSSKVHYTPDSANAQGAHAGFLESRDYQEARESSLSRGAISLEGQLQLVTPCTTAHRHTREEVKM